MRNPRTRRRTWLLIYLLSLLVNWGGLLALLWLFLWEEPGLPETVTYLDLTEAEGLDAPTEPERERNVEPSVPAQRIDRPPPVPKPRPKRREKKKDIELEELPEPEDEKEKEEPKPDEPEPEEKAADPPPHFVLEQLKMVEQPDELDEKQAPESYDYLSNVNRDVQEQTRARLTNLERDAVEAKARQEQPSRDTSPGTSAETAVARVEERRSRREDKAPNVEPSPREQREAAPDRRRSLLAMRDLEPRRHQVSQDENDPMANLDEQGELGRRQDRRDTVVPRRQEGASRDPAEVSRFRLTRNDMDALFGRDVEAHRDMLSKQASKRRGIWDGPRDHFQSPLENMVPEVRPGNQTALRSRKHPFARYIATIHRSIHESWAWGFLEQLDMRGNGHPLNRRDLWTRLEIVLRADGTVEKVTTVRPSGNLVFDAAARETVWAVGPFPPAPRSIVSPNGNVYIHWAFHRDERACGTFGATPFILDGTGGDRPDPHVEVRPGRGAVRRLSREGPSPAAKATPAAGASASEGASGPGRRNPPPAAPYGPAAAERRAVSAAPAAPTIGGRTPPSAAPTEVDRARAKEVADRWLHDLATGDVARMAARSGLPFSVSGRVVARSRRELEAVFRSLVEETGTRPKGARIVTAAELRRLLGGIPAGVLEGLSRIYALTRIGDDYVVLILERPLGALRVVGIAR